MQFSDKIIIDTPEQVALDYEIAGIGSRFMALFVDLMIQFLALVAIGLTLFLVGVALSLTGAGTWIIAILILLLFLLHWAYFAAFEIWWKGQTPGKRQAQIRVISESGREITPFEAITRNLLRAIDSMPGPYAVGAITMFLNKQSKRLGDFAAGTVVIHDRRPEDQSIFFNTRESQEEHALSFASVTLDEIQLIETFLQRRLDLPVPVRFSTAQKLADRIGEKIGVAKSERGDDENFLESVVRGFRRSARYHTQSS